MRERDMGDSFLTDITSSWRMALPEEPAWLFQQLFLLYSCLGARRHLERVATADQFMSSKPSAPPPQYVRERARGERESERRVRVESQSALRIDGQSRLYAFELFTRYRA